MILILLTACLKLCILPASGQVRLPKSLLFSLVPDKNASAISRGTKTGICFPLLAVISGLPCLKPAQTLIVGI